MTERPLVLCERCGHDNSSQVMLRHPKRRRRRRRYCRKCGHPFTPPVVERSVPPPAAPPSPVPFAAGACDATAGTGGVRATQVPMLRLANHDRHKWRKRDDETVSDSPSNPCQRCGRQLQYHSSPRSFGGGGTRETCSCGFRRDY